jgi:hypothetical protein
MATDYYIRPRAKLKLHGQSNSNQAKPLAVRLIEWWRVATIDTTISAILDIIISTLISGLDEITHVDDEIQQSLRDNIARMRDHHGNDLQTQLHEVFYSTLVSGFSVAENDLELVDGKILLRSLINYDPSSITIRTDSRGRLVEGSRRNDGLYSGIFQSGPFFGGFTHNLAEVSLPLWKVVHLRNRGRFGNYYGNSAIEPVYRWHLLSDAITDIMAESMDTYAEPWMVVSIAHEETSETVQDPFTGLDRAKTTQEIFREQFQNAGGSGGKIITIPYISQATKPEVKIVTPPSNLGTMFIDTLDHIEQNKARGLLTPFMLLGDTRQAIGNTPVERRMEVFYRIIDNLYAQFVVPLVAQTFHRLVKFNFSSREASKYAPVLPRSENQRPEDRVALMQLVAGLTRNGYLTPTNAEDWGSVRRWLNIASRQMTQEDVEYIESILIDPLSGEPASPDNSEKTDDPENEDTKSSGSGSTGTRSDDPMRRTRDRTKEGKVQGKGRRGRPPGTSAPKSKTSLSNPMEQLSIEDLIPQ